MVQQRGSEGLTRRLVIEILVMVENEAGQERWWKMEGAEVEGDGRLGQWDFAEEEECHEGMVEEGRDLPGGRWMSQEEVAWALVLALHTPLIPAMEHGIRQEEQVERQKGRNPALQMESLVCPRRWAVVTEAPRCFLASSVLQRCMAGQTGDNLGTEPGLAHRTSSCAGRSVSHGQRAWVGTNGSLLSPATGTSHHTPWCPARSIASKHHALFSSSSDSLLYAFHAWRTGGYWTFGVH